MMVGWSQIKEISPIYNITSPSQTGIIYVLNTKDIHGLYFNLFLGAQTN